MTPDQALFMTHAVLPQTENEFQTTKKVIAAIPAEQSGYKPDPKAKSALDLAWHIASSEVWFLESVAACSFAAEPGAMPEGMKTPADVLAWYEPAFHAAVAKVRALSGEQLATPVSFYGVFNLPAGAYLGFNMNHSVHHRGQLSTYLRPMGSTCPSIYGGSADEPFRMPATA